MASLQKMPDVMNSPDILVYKDPKAALQSWGRKLHERYGSKVVGAKDVRLQQGECIL